MAVWDDAARIVVRARLVVRDGPTCHYCRCLVGTKRRPATLDHLWPRALGRVDFLWNLVLACAPCNSARGADLDWCSCTTCRRARFLGSLATAVGVAS